MFLAHYHHKILEIFNIVAFSNHSSLGQSWKYVCPGNMYYFTEVMYVCPGNMYYFTEVKLCKQIEL